MVSGLSRRHFLSISGGLAIGLAVAWDASPLMSTSASASADESEFAVLRAAWKDLSLGVGFDPARQPFTSKLAALGRQARTQLGSLAPAPGALWPDLVYGDPEPDTDSDSFAFSGRMTATFNRLRSMAEAYAQPGTGMTNDPALRQGILAGLDHMTTDVFREGTPGYGNWWDFQIGAPQALMDTAVLMFADLTPDQRARYCAAVDYHLPDSIVASYTENSTGANRVDLCRGIILSGIVSENPARIVLGRDALSPVFPYVSSGDGYYADGSFIQHLSIPYIGGYGAVLLDGLGRLFALLAGSSWEVTDPNRQLFLDTIERSVAPFIFSGLMMDMVSSRGVTRPSGTQFTRAHPILAAIALIAKGADPAQAARWRGLVKGWLERNTHDPVLTTGNTTLSRLAYLQEVWSSPTVAALPEPVEHRIFPQMDRATHRRPGWAIGISMSSERISHYECGNGENLRGWHTGAGWVQWWSSDTISQYADGYWPTVDPYRMPGTTASLKPLQDGEGGAWVKPRPSTKWAGGTTDGEFGVTGQHVQGLSSTMEAHKSWFSLDAGLLCLGSGISSSDGYAVETTVENRQISSSAPTGFVVDGVRQPDAPGWSADLTDIGWAHIEGHGGYVFPGRASVRATRQDRTGRWLDVNTLFGTPAAVTRRYLTLSIDHGEDPSGGGYGYLLLPGATQRETQRAAGALVDQFDVLERTPDCHAVEVRRLGLIAANFWSAGTAGGITVSQPVSVLVRRSQGVATISVADPARQASGLELVWNTPVTRVLSQPGSVEDISTGSALRIRFGDLTGSAGATQQVSVKL